MPTRQSFPPLAGVFIVLLPVVLAALIRLQMVPPEPKGAEASVEEFSAGRAMAFLERVLADDHPHPIDSPANRAIELAIRDELERLGYTPEIQQRTSCVDGDGWARCARVRNVVAVLKGQSDQGILLSAHYDSVPAAPGASDAMTAVATLLEAARLLKRVEQPRNTVVLLFNDGEEAGLLGARAFMQHHPLADSLRVALNIEARGSSGQSVMFETGANSGWLVEALAATSPAPAASSVLFEAYQALPNDTDMTVFKEHGLQGLNFAHAENLVHYHTPLDSLATLDRGSLQHHGDNIWGVLSRIKDRDLDATPEGNRVYADLGSYVLVSWDESFSVVLVGIASALCLLLLIVGKRLGQVRLARVGGAILALIAGLVASALGVWVVVALEQGITAYSAPWTANVLATRWAAGLAVLLMTLLLAKVVVRWMTGREIALAFALLTVVLSAVSVVFSPGVVVLFLPSALAGLLAVAIILARTNAAADQPLDGIGWVVLGVSAIVPSWSFFSMAFVLEAMVSYQMAAAVGLMFGFAAMGWLAFLAERPQALRPAVLSTVAAAVLASVVWSLMTPSYSSGQPQHITLDWVDKGGDEVALLVGSSERQLPQVLIDALPGATSRQAVLPWSEYAFRQVPLDAESIALPAADIQVGDKPGVWRLRWPVPPEALREVRWYFAADSGLSAIEYGGESLGFSGEQAYFPQHFAFRCIGQSCGGSSVQAMLAPDWQGEVLAVAIYQGLPGAAADLLQLRDAVGVPVHSGDQTYLIRRFAF
jgi:hypothetical protein